MIGLATLAGIFANVSGQMLTKQCLSKVAVQSGVKVIDKLFVPAGAFIAGCMVGDAMDDYANGKVKEVQDFVNKAKQSKDVDIKLSGSTLTIEAEGTPEVVNIFDKAKEEEENGES